MSPKPESISYEFNPDSFLEIGVFTKTTITLLGSEMSMGLKFTSEEGSKAFCVLNASNYSEEKDDKIVEAFKQFVDTVAACHD